MQLQDVRIDVPTDDPEVLQVLSVSWIIRKETVLPSRALVLSRFFFWVYIFFKKLINQNIWQDCRLCSSCSSFCSPGNWSAGTEKELPRVTQVWSFSTCAPLSPRESWTYFWVLSERGVLNGHPLGPVSCSHQSIFAFICVIDIIFCQRNWSQCTSFLAKL